jgi:hypothetical protein
MSRGRAEDAEALARLERLVSLLDDRFSLGGFRFGLDGLVGLVPGVGDGLGLLASAYVVLEAARLGAPRAVLLRMAVNLLLDFLVGAVPVLGDLFDFAFKANRRNLELLRRALAARR